MFCMDYCCPWNFRSKTIYCSRKEGHPSSTEPCAVLLCVLNNSVAYRGVARQRSRNKRDNWQPLLCNWRINNGAMKTVSRQQIGKHVRAAQQCSYFWKRCFLLGSCKVVIRKIIGTTQLVSFRVEAGSNNPTVALRVVKGNEKGI
jgi:hypothetical protein